MVAAPDLMEASMSKDAKRPESKGRATAAVPMTDSETERLTGGVAATKMLDKVTSDLNEVKAKLTRYKDRVRGREGK